jgi:hypothetical protein
MPRAEYKIERLNPVAPVLAAMSATVLARLRGQGYSTIDPMFSRRQLLATLSKITSLQPNDTVTD